MIPQEIYRMYDILRSFLGDSKGDLDETYQLQFACPHCVDKYGANEKRKYNLEVSLSKNRFNCWKCASEENEMHGTVPKLIKKYGNETLLREYKDAVKALRESKLYKLSFSDDEFNLNDKTLIDDEISLPASFKDISGQSYIPKKVSEYLQSRNITKDIIDEYNIGYSGWDWEKPNASYRIYIPSYDRFGELNYWTGRDYVGKSKQKYFNPKVERKDIIFNEGKISWDADITLVEGPFDHIVVPNSIPLLGKNLNEDFKLYWDILNKANANINIFLDADAFETTKNLYHFLNHGRLLNRIRYIPLSDDLDPSKIHELWGKKGIIQFIRSARKLNPHELI
jgi:hypothetical protein